MKKIHFSIFIFLVSFNVSAQLYFTDPDDLVEAVNSSLDGGTFIITDGVYQDFEASFEAMATADNPILIKAETVGGVILQGESHFVFKKSAFISLQGFIFDCQGEESLIKLEGCNNIRISRNVFELKTTESVKWVFVGGVWNDNTYPFSYPSHNNRIDHNTFQNKETPGHYITIDGSFDNTGSDEVYYQSQHDVIDHNYFKNNGPRAANEQESIRVGWSEMSLSSGYTILEHNLFENCDGDPEIVSIKSCDNIIRHNTFKASYGTLSLRHGNRNRVVGNYFFGDGKPIGTSPAGATLYTGGIRIYGADHVIVNNYMEGLNGTRWDAPITLTLGDAINGQSANLSKHFRAERVTIAYNTLVNNSHGIEIGFDNNNNYNKDLKDITIANNLITGSENSLVEIVDTDNDQGELISWKSNLMYPTSNANLLTGATTTSFDNSEAINENPFLVFNNNRNIWQTTGSSPTYDHAVSNVQVEDDIEGQQRPTASNPGADHFSSDDIRFTPLTPSDVGPNAYNDTNTSAYSNNNPSELIIFPNPANDLLYVNNIDSKITKVEVINSEGKIVFRLNLKAVEKSLTINTTNLVNGLYIVKLYENEFHNQTKKIIIQH